MCNDSIKSILLMKKEERDSLRGDVIEVSGDMRGLENCLCQRLECQAGDELGSPKIGGI